MNFSTALLFSILSGLLNFVYANRLYLDGSDWTFRSTNGSYKGNAIVPGSCEEVVLTTDQKSFYPPLKATPPFNNPLYGSGDQDYKWVGRSDWIYQKLFTLPSNASGLNKYVLVFQSLDTIVAGYLNGEQIFTSQNLFVPVTVDVTRSIQPTTTNNLTLVFSSPVATGKNLHEEYRNSVGHDLGGGCQTPSGECYLNFIRKTQSSFGWDWGPTFATMGVVDHVYLDYFNDVDIFRVAPLITYDSTKTEFNMQVDVWVFCVNGASANVTIQLDQNQITQSFSSLNCTLGNPSSVSLGLAIPDSSVNRWWPNGYGNQTLYGLNTQLTVNGNVVGNNTLKIGFRTIETVEDQIDPTNASIGNTFYFKVNNLPIFLKGSNLVPISLTPSQNNTLRKQFILKSMQISHMNTLRVWGGGLYEYDDFYELADQYGIMLWHDHMFACAEFPNNPDFLNLVAPEIRYQVSRLRHHPSILAWAGNNEDELGVRDWWGKSNTQNYSLPEQIADYIALNRDIVQNITESLDPSRPFILSSPTNGKQSIAEGYVALDPGSEHYGDAHCYNYNGNLWKPDTAFPIPRCASEFGSQSLPLKGRISFRVGWKNF